VRSLRPLFSRTNRGDALEREAEKLKNRDWVEFLQVVHPSQAEKAETEYMLSRLRADWAELTTALLSTHTQPQALSNGNLLVLCDHNTFANELSMVAKVVEQKILNRYEYRLRIHARASKRIDWQDKSKI